MVPGTVTGKFRRVVAASGMRRCRESCVSPDLRGNAPLGVGSRSSQLRGISVSPHDNGVPEWLSFSSSPAACMPPCINQETTTVMFWPFGVRMQSSPSDALTSTDALRTTGSAGARPDLHFHVAHPLHLATIVSQTAPHVSLQTGSYPAATSSGERALHLPWCAER
jgi:hypothetical protein